jgi:hypothetical protein
LFAAGLVSGQLRAQANNQPSVDVEVDNYAALSSDALSTAEVVASSIFSNVGVTLRWSGVREPRNEPIVGNGIKLRLVLLPAAMANRMIVKQQIEDDVLGLAVSPAGIAYVFCHRVTMAATNRGLIATTLLGRVVAHELGHLLLSSVRGHPSTGVMHRSVSVRSGRLEAFTPAQGARLRARAVEPLPLKEEVLAIAGLSALR